MTETPPLIVTLRNAHLEASISAKGAELQSLRPLWGEEMIWSGDPAVWGWHAPNLFPIVGALADDQLCHQGQHYPLASHGFLRHSPLALAEHHNDHVAFRLSDSDETHRQFPFAFDLTVHFQLVEDQLLQRFQIRNPGPSPLYFSLGAHPAFRWPLADGLARADHRLYFSEPEPQEIRRLAGKLMGPDGHPTPVTGRILVPTDAMFTEDAIIWDHLHSSDVRFGVPGQLGVALHFPDFPHFGVWSKPGAGYLCLEPWQGHTSPAGFTGEFSDKPGVIRLAPGADREWRMSIRPLRTLSPDP